MFIHQKRIILNFNSYLFLFRSSLFPNLFITCLGRERKNVGEGTVKVVICLDLAIKLGNGRAVTFVLESADALHGRLSLPPLRQGIFLIHATMRCTRANKQELSQRGVERPLAFSPATGRKTSGDKLRDNEHNNCYFYLLSENETESGSSGFYRPPTGGGQSSPIRRVDTSSTRFPSFALSVNLAYLGLDPCPLVDSYYADKFRTHTIRFLPSKRAAIAGDIYRFKKSFEIFSTR